MGYSQTYYENIDVYGSVTVSYPASQNGGTRTASYHEIVPVQINVYVDTDAFDESVYYQKARVDGLTAAVTAMKTAQVMAIHESSQQIADHLVDGFYNTINSELSMQQSEKKTDIQAKFGLMKSIADQIATTHRRMEDDLAKLKRHYSEIFKGLDEDLEKRIYELDKNVFDLSINVRDGLVSGVYKDNVPTVMNEINTSSSTHSMISAARLNNKTSEIIGKMLNSVEASKGYLKSLSTVTNEDDIDEACLEFVPAIVANLSDTNNDGKMISECYVPNVAGKESIATCLRQDYYGNQAYLKEKFSNEEKEIIENNLVLLIEENQTEEESDQRISNEIMRMWKEDKERIQK